MEEKEQRSRKELSEQNKKLARERALVILQVRSGALTAKEGALENRPSGRPPLTLDPEKEALRERVRELEKKLDLAEKTIEVKELLAAYEGFREKGTKKNR
jgi:hypothetical protein